MASIKINDYISWTGVHDEMLRRFDIVMETAEGTTYNAYIIKGKDKTVLIDGSKTGFGEQWLANIREVTPIEDIDLVVIQHSEPDHASAFNVLLDIKPDLEFYGSTLALANLKEIVNRPINAHVIKPGETYDLGGLTLKFLITPNVHWPDTIMTYVPELKVLFSCDFLGEHYSFESLYHSKLKSKKTYDHYFKHYYDSIMAPMARFVNLALNQLKPLEIDMVLPSHGPVLDTKEAVNYALRKYTEWSIIPKNEVPQVVIAYCSNYGYTKALAETMYQSIVETGVGVKMYDIIEVPEQKVVKEILAADGFLVGSPTIMADVIRPVYDILNSLPIYLVQGKKASAFGSYGWSGEAVPNLITRLKQLRYKVDDEGLAIRLQANASELEQAKQFALTFVAKLK